MKKSYHSIVVPIAARQGDAPRFDRPSEADAGRHQRRGHAADIRARDGGDPGFDSTARIPSPTNPDPHPDPESRDGLY